MLVANNIGTDYYGPLIDQDPAGTEAVAQQVFPVGGSLSNLNVRLTGSPSAGDSYVFTLRVNGAGTEQTCTVAGTATSCTDGTGNLAVPAGGLVSIQVTETGTPDSQAGALDRPVHLDPVTRRGWRSNDVRERCASPGRTPQGER